MMILIVSFRDWKQQGFKIECKGTEKMKNKQIQPKLSKKINFFWECFISPNYPLCFHRIMKSTS